MNIEFHAPHGQVKEWVINYAKDHLMKLHRHDQDISRAQVYFREKADQRDGGKICEIELTIPGGSLFVHRQAVNYEQALRKVLEELANKVLAVVREK
ncbi:MAG TPA: HPF/RaiA family ribosome-associated protein [Chitinophagaceae bacterium]